jgi:tRNA modification GTPase
MIPRWITKVCNPARKTVRSKRTIFSYSQCYPVGLGDERAHWNVRSFSHDSQSTPAQAPSPRLPFIEPSPGLVQSTAQRRTIYALSTPPGKAGIAVVRISGPAALDVWHSMVSTRSKVNAAIGKHVKAPEPWRMCRIEVLHPETKELLDSGLAVYFKGPLVLIYILQDTHTMIPCQ